MIQNMYLIHHHKLKIYQNQNVIMIYYIHNQQHQDIIKHKIKVYQKYQKVM